MPHFGGAHESLVKSTNRTLYNALEIEGNSQRHPTEDVFYRLSGQIVFDGFSVGLAGATPSDARDPKDQLSEVPDGCFFFICLQNSTPF